MHALTPAAQSNTVRLRRAPGPRGLTQVLRVIDPPGGYLVLNYLASEVILSRLWFFINKPM